MKKIFRIVLVLFCLAIAAPAVMATAAEPTRVATADVAKAKVNVNTATVKELQGLPGIGQVTAERIVAYRTEKGKFRSVSDLRNVKGIGEKSLEKIRNFVSIE